MAKITYTSKDYDGFRRTMIEAIPDRLPEWTSRSASDPGIVLIELFAHVGDILSYYGDRVANEAFLSTATQRRSVLDIANMLDYSPRGVRASTGAVTFTFDTSDGSVTVPKNTVLSTSSAAAAAAGQDPVYYTTDEAITNTDTQVSVAVTQGELVTGEVLGTSDGTAGQRMSLFEEDVVEGSVTVYVEGTPWAYLSHLVDATENEQAYTLFTDENGVTTVIFGDDANGAIPTVGGTITADYRVGRGTEGNVGAGTLTELSSPITGVASVTNPDKTTGGADPESVSDIRDNAPRSLRSLSRAVTLRDFEDLAVLSGYVGKASAVASASANVLLYVAPRVQGLVSQANKDALSMYLEDKVLFGTTVSLLDPTYHTVEVNVSMTVNRTFQQATVERNVENTIKAFFGFDNTTFGQTITLADLIGAISPVEGLDRFEVTRLRRNDEPTATVGDVVMREFEVADETPTLTLTTTGGII